MNYDFTGITDEFALIAEGEYEVFVEKIEIKQYSTGTEYINIQLRIRTDVEQEHQNRVLFDKVLKEKDSNIFNRARLSRIMKSAIPENTPLNFDSLEDVLDTLVGKKLRAVVTIRHNDYFGEDENSIYYYKPTANPDKVVGASEPQTTHAGDVKATNVITNIEDDLPF